jgi:hypothetical protein
MGDQPVIQVIHKDLIADAGKTWAQTIAGLLTIGGIVTLVQGGGTVQNLQPAAREDLEHFLIAALAAAIIAVILAFSAAFDPGFLRLPQEFRLYLSVCITVVAVILLFLAARTIWNNQKNYEGLYFVSYEQDKIIACGMLSTQPDGRLLFMQTPVAGVTAITAADKGCPNPTPTT